ncbi:hypothetical protein HPB52_006307 [Rhipicephalus sanguineus]|uniref:Uncharacterized protein n=1 Tax=Rhipicephalus sanguineus TaxID=34632 RepID=A0A9D4PQ17_RHISA|nr:hypothetical protein HPB52_006307 [Rhipicephalus sanguineus]
MLSLLPAFPRRTSLQSSMEFTEHCCQGQYCYSNRPTLPTSMAPVVQTSGVVSKFSAFRNNIEREGTSKEQLAALTIPPLCQQLLPLGRMKSWLDVVERAGLVCVLRDPFEK